MKRAGGDCLVLRTGEPPHVLTGDGRHDVAKAVLSANALEALVAQVFSDEGRRTLGDTGLVTEVIDVPDASLTLTARAEREGDRVTIELRPSVPAPEAVAEEQPQIQWFETPQPLSPEQTFEAAPSFADAAPDAQPDASGVLAFQPDLASLPEPVLVDEPAYPQEPEQRYELAPPEPLVTFEPGPAVGVDIVFEDVHRIHDPGSLDDAGVPHVAEAERVPFVPEPRFDIEIASSREPAPQGPTWMISEPEPLPPSFELAAETYEEPPVTFTPHFDSVESPSATPAPMRESLPSGIAAWAARAASRSATAVYFRAGVQPLARIDDRLEPLVDEPVESWLFDELLDELNGGLGRGWEPGSGGEWVRHQEGLGLVSCWKINDDQGPGLMIRLRQQKPTRSLHKFIPRKVRGACDGDGLIVVSAATTADVFAVASAVADLAGKRRGGYVIALRPAGAPRHDITGAFVSQREFSGSDGDVAAAIRSAANESPDVMVVAPPQSEAALREVVHATESGRLVILAVLAPTSMQALRAIVGRASSGGDAQTRLALATSFRAAFTYRVLQRLGGGRTLVRDLIVGTSEVSALLASGDFTGIARVQREGQMSMNTVDDALARAVRRGHLSLRQAAAQAVDRRHLVSLVRAARRQSPRASRGREPFERPAAREEVFETVGSSRRSAGEPRHWSGY